MVIPSLIERKRDGSALAPGTWAAIVRAYDAGEIPDYQMSALLMAVVWRGLAPAELSELTSAMLASGDRLRFGDWNVPRVDKHSTGGVGDKTSLLLAPMLACCGAAVPMMSGRGLGHTGGTLDKLESIPGFSTRLALRDAIAQVKQIGCALFGQTPEIAPVDRRLYALRDVTGTVPSVPLIAASIMSKKLAEGLDALVLDVKVGAGAFTKRQVDARRLAQMMVGIGRRRNKRVVALITDMNQPLGYAIGNALEVMEVSQTLQNVGPMDLTRLSLELAARMIYLGKITKTQEEARELAQQKLLDGSGYKKLKEVIQSQGGNPQVLDKFELLPNATGAREVASPRAGFVTAIDAQVIGQASAIIGAGRDRKEDAVDPAVGVILEVKVGDKVDVGGILCRLYYTKEDRVEEAADMVEDAFRISTTEPEKRELILEVVS